MSKLNKPPAFLLCENPISTKSDGRQFIFHNRSPRMLVEVIAFENLLPEQQLDFQRQMPQGSRLDYPPETFYFIPSWIESGFQPRDGETDQEYQQKTADKLASVFRRMADWYKSYLIWEDSQPNEAPL